MLFDRIEENLNKNESSIKNKIINFKRTKEIVFKVQLIFINPWVNELFDIQGVTTKKAPF